MKGSGKMRTENQQLDLETQHSLVTLTETFCEKWKLHWIGLRMEGKMAKILNTENSLSFSVKPVDP